MLEACHVSKTFHIGRGKEVHAVRDASLRVEEGEIVGLLGPNGAGKTTLLRMLATIITPTGGHCSVAGHRTDDAPEEVRRHIGFMSGNTKLYARLRAHEVLRYFGRLYGMSDSAIDQRVSEVSALLDMETFIDQQCRALSTGQTQRVSIARVIFHDPPALILDEPTLGLDILSSRTILDFIRTARDRNRAIIFSTHYMTEAELLCDRIAFIHDGQILATGTKEALYEQTGTSNLQEAFLAMTAATPEGVS